MTKVLFNQHRISKEEIEENRELIHKILSGELRYPNNKKLQTMVIKGKPFIVPKSIRKTV